MLVIINYSQLVRTPPA